MVIIGKIKRVYQSNINLMLTEDLEFKVSKVLIASVTTTLLSTLCALKD